MLALSALLSGPSLEQPRVQSEQIQHPSHRMVYDSATVLGRV